MDTKLTEVILHAGLHDASFIIWGELPDKFATDDCDAVLHAPASKSATKSLKLAEHPFALTFAQLIAAINNVASKALCEGADSRKVNIWLPSFEAIPLSSDSYSLDRELESEVSSQKKSGLKKPNLNLWAVNGIALDGSRFVEFLSATKHRQILASGIHLSEEFEYLWQLLRFSASTVVRQQFIPTIKTMGKEMVAFWAPVITGDDQTKLFQLSKQASPVLRAVCQGTLSEQREQKISAKPLALPQVETTITIVQNMLDGIIKNSIAATSRQSSKALKSKEDEPTPGAPVNESHSEAFERRFGNAYKLEGASLNPQSRHGSVHECWLNGLRSSTGKLHFDRSQLVKFLGELVDWQMPATAFNAAPLRLCFRLEEPDKSYEKLESTDNSPSLHATEEVATGKWNVHYLLQSAADPSLLIPASQAWHNSADVRLAFGQNELKPREYLLLSLAKASRVSPSILESLSIQNPSGFQLDNRGAFEYLTDTVPSLVEAGFSVLLPQWWTDKGRSRLKLTGRKFRSASSGNDGFDPDAKFSLQSLLKFDWQASIGDTPLTLQELEALASLKSSLVNMRGEWVHIDPRDLESIIQFMKKRGGVTASLQDIIHYSIGATSPLPESSGVSIDIQADSWLGELIGELKAPGQFANIVPATTFNGTLRPYQERGFSWLYYLSTWGLGACLADDMGLGKTIQTLALVQKRKEQGELNPALLICPTSVVDNWRKEAEKFAPDLKVHVHHGGKRTKGLSFRTESMQFDIVISSYSLLDRDKQFLLDVPWSGMILDEAQNIKNSESKQARAAHEISCGYKFALTGTPVENSVNDLWSIMSFLNPNLLGTRNAFRKDFVEPIQIARDKHKMTKLQKIVQPFILRRLKTDKQIIDDLPEKQEMKVFCTLTREQVSLYRAATKELEKELKAETASGRSAVVLSAMTRLKQICNHPAQYLDDNFGLADRSGKLARLEEMLEEVLACGEKAIIFSQFAQMGKLIKMRLEEKLAAETLFLHGGTSRKLRTEMVERFQSTDGPALFVLSLKAGGTGINLTAANHVFHYDRWWNPAVENQATDRAFRIGQKKNVQVHKFICAGTLEEKIDTLISSKQELADSVVGTGEGWLGKLTNEELRNVFALSKEAFAE